MEFINSKCFAKGSSFFNRCLASSLSRFNFLAFYLILATQKTFRNCLPLNPFPALQEIITNLSAERRSTDALHNRARLVQKRHPHRYWLLTGPSPVVTFLLRHSCGADAFVVVCF
jgi:hypothetical protein